MHPFNSSFKDSKLSVTCVDSEGKNCVIDFGQVIDLSVTEEMVSSSCSTAIGIKKTLEAEITGPYSMRVIENKEEKNHYIPKCIKQSGSHTIVYWEDGTFTHVKASKEDEVGPDAYVAFCAALAKKMFGTNSAVHRVVDRHMAEYLETQKKKEQAEIRRREEARMNEIHDREVKALAKQLRLKEEAKEYNRQHRYDDED